MKTEAKNIKQGDTLSDNEGLELIVKKIKRAGNKISITFNYLENGFYKANDKTKTVNINTKIYKVN